MPLRARDSVSDGVPVTTAYIRPRGSAWWHRVRPDESGVACSAVVEAVSDVVGPTHVYGPMVTECNQRIEVNGAAFSRGRPDHGRLCGRCG